MTYLNTLKTSISMIFIISFLLFKSPVKIDLPLPNISSYLLGKYEFELELRKSVYIAISL